MDRRYHGVDRAKINEVGQIAEDRRQWHRLNILLIAGHRGGQNYATTTSRLWNQLRDLFPQRIVVISLF